ncbi:zinc-finger-containing protein, partial [Stenotrophomonas maltophilia]|uniref:zinc-finger-containing protein n=1 Tax=Stenotrophomonas maltophilia TaxID=40324 RepID=UPI00195352D3
MRHDGHSHVAGPLHSTARIPRGECMKLPICPYCGSSSELTSGRTIYPGRIDLWNRTFYRCRPCDGHVGTHRGTNL